MKRDTLRREKHGRRGLVALIWVVFLLGGCLNGREQVQGFDVNAGRNQYEKHCAACHQPDGSGAEGGGPPLAGSSWVCGPESRLTRIILHGLRGSIDVRGETYNREMLGFGVVITDDQIAALLTYVRGRWGDIDGPVRASDVRRIRRATRDRTAYWTVEELLQIP